MGDDFEPRWSPSKVALFWICIALALVVLLLLGRCL